MYEQIAQIAEQEREEAKALEKLLHDRSKSGLNWAEERTKRKELRILKEDIAVLETALRIYRRMRHA